MQRKAIIIGATGRVGQALVQELSSLYETVIVIARTPPKLMSKNMQFYALVDFENLQSTLSAIVLDDKTDAFCCLWAQSTNSEMLQKIHYKYPQQFAQLCYDKGVRSLFLLSKAGADVHATNAVLQARGKLHQTLSAMPWQHLLIFMVDKVALAKELSLRGLGKRALYFAWQLLLADKPLTPTQIGVSMALHAFYIHYQKYQSPSDKPPDAQCVEYISHKQMLLMTEVLSAKR